MLRLTKKVEYALKAMYFIAVVRNNQRTGVAELSEALGLPKRFVEQIFLRLRKAGLLKSYRGAHGGYQLEAPFESICLGQILDALGEQNDARRGFGAHGEDRFVRIVNDQLMSFVRDLQLDRLVTDRMRSLVQDEGPTAIGRMYYI